MLIKMMATGVLASLIGLGAQAPAGYAGDQAQAKTARTAPQGEGSTLDMLAPLLTAPAVHEPQKVCKPGELYSSHDVVGDPDTCTIGRIDIHGGNSAAVGPGAF